MPRTFTCSMFHGVRLTVGDLDSDRDMEFSVSPGSNGRIWLDEDERRELIKWLVRYTAEEEEV